MAARKKAPRRKSSARKGTRRKAARTKRPARKKASRKKTPARKKAARKGAARRKKTPARKKATTKRPAQRKKAAAGKKKAAASKPTTLEALARRIIRAASDPSGLRDLYSESCTSLESGSTEPVVGISGLEQKLRMWESMQKGTTWKPRNTFIKGNTIAIEWQADVTLNSGQVVRLNEVAVHEIKGGKIAAERYYYDPSALQPAQPAAPEPPPPEPSPPARSSASGASSGDPAWNVEYEASNDDEPPEGEDPRGKDVDPFDL
jgi:ketosteroid isomerase-like protein